jgi:hypothetical protein
MLPVAPGMPTLYGVLPAWQSLSVFVVPRSKTVEVARGTEVVVDVLVEAGRVMVEVTTVPGGVTVTLVELSGS